MYIKLNKFQELNETHETLIPMKIKQSYHTGFTLTLQ